MLKRNVKLLIYIFSIQIEINFDFKFITLDNKMIKYKLTYWTYKNLKMQTKPVESYLLINSLNLNLFIYIYC